MAHCCSMCGRYVSPKAADIEREWNIRHAPNPFDGVNWNVAPTHMVPGVRRGAGGEPELAALRWGLIPFWAKGMVPKFGTINATIERMKEAPTYRGPWKHGRRVIVPAFGFYEWQQVQGPDGKVGKKPYYIQVGDQPVFGMAGLWDASTAADGTVVESCTLITMPANRMMAAIHNGRERMPAILVRADHEGWLSGDADAAFTCLKPYPDELMIARHVSSRVNSPKNNDETLVDDVGEP